jgi:hypothetical protein
MTTSTHDRYGNELLPKAKERRLDLLSREQFDGLPSGLKKQYFATKEYRLRQRLDGAKVEALLAVAGMTIDEALAYCAKVKEYR